MKAKTLSEKDADQKAKAFGEAHGYFWMPGGYVYKEGRDKPICQGWWKFYSLNKNRIEAWVKEQES